MNLKLENKMKYLEEIRPIISALCALCPCFGHGSWLKSKLREIKNIAPWASTWIRESGHVCKSTRM